MSYDVKVLADSTSPDAVRITTLCCTYPRFIHSELMTHRVFGRNAASSRALPPERVIENIQNHPFVPDFNKRVKGMGHGDPLNEHDAKIARTTWLNARDKAVQAASVLIDLDVDKARINRLLEPFSWMTTIITATEWSNFFALRQPSNDRPVPQIDFPAQAEFQVVARMMRDAVRDSTSVALDYGQWHLPLFADRELYDIGDAIKSGSFTSDDLQLEAAKISAGRCARVSFDTHSQYEDPDVSLERFARLSGSAHWSAMEHSARPMVFEDDYFDALIGPKIYGPIDDCGVLPRVSEVFCGHLRGWVCLRKLYENEQDRSLVIVERPEVERQ